MVTERAFQVCAEQGCSKCGDLVFLTDMPDNCEYEILHVLAKKEQKGWRKRRSGKSTYLMNLAATLSVSFNVYYILPNVGMAKNTGAMFNMKRLSEERMKKVHFMGQTQMRHGVLRGRPPGLVILDEVRPGEMEQYLVPPACFPIVAALWT